MNLKTIASLAGVSQATVSNVVNGNFHKVSDETRKRVEKIIEENDYRPSIMARSLAKKESRIIGVVLPYVGSGEDFLSNPYNAHVIAAIEKYVRQRDYYIMFRCVSEVREILPLLSAWNVDGAIFLGVFEPEIKDIIKGLDAPAVFIDTYSEEDNIVNIGIDDYKGGYNSAKYLLGKGHRRVALVTPGYTTRGVIEERHRGFMDACRDEGIDIGENDIFEAMPSYHESISVGQDIAASDVGYTAIATMSDVAAIGIIEGLEQFGKRVPEDISVIGFDNIPEGGIITPKLTTVEQNYDSKAEYAVQYLFMMMKEDAALQADIRLPVQIRERQSVIDIRKDN